MKLWNIFSISSQFTINYEFFFSLVCYLIIWVLVLHIKLIMLIFFYDFIYFFIKGEWKKKTLIEFFLVKTLGILCLINLFYGPYSVNMQMYEQNRTGPIHLTNVTKTSLFFFFFCTNHTILWLMEFQNYISLC